MKIGIDARAANWYRGTGIGTYTYQIINCLNKIDNLNNYLLFMAENSNCNISFSENFNLKNIFKKSEVNNFWSEVNIPNILHDNEVELYHVPQNGVGLPEDKKCKFVITLHDVIPYRMPETCSENYLKIFNEKIPKIVNSCDGIITVSKFSKDDIVKAFNISEDKVHVTYLAAEDIYKPVDKNLSKDVLNRFYSIDGDFILYVGGFSPRKNILGLIDAFGKLKNNYKKDIKLVIVGNKGKSYAIYKDQVEKLGIDDDVIFTGFIPMEHMPYLYSAASLFVYPSFYEGFGLPPIEAMSCGCPVIASNSTSVGEILKDSAFLINPSDVEDIYKAMKDMLNNPELRSDFIKKGFKKTNSLSWNETARNTLNIYKKIALTT